MSETKRIYVPVSNNGELAFYKNIDDHSVTLVYKNDVVPHLVPYEPAVPRCATCEHFRKILKLVWCINNLNMNTPPDGSGYCHRHSELNK